jgi:hypothetical protein
MLKFCTLGPPSREICEVLIYVTGAVWTEHYYTKRTVTYNEELLNNLGSPLCDYNDGIFNKSS